MNSHLLASTVLLAVLALPAQADVLVQWNFNDSTLTPAVGTGTAALVGTTGSFVSGAGSSDPATTPDQSWSSTGYPAQGTGDKTEGVSFLFSTVGFENLVISFDNRQSNTGTKYLQLQYTLDGLSFTDATSGLFTASGGSVWNNGNSVDLSAVAGAADNASFGFRIVSTFAPGTSTYVAADGVSTYGTTGTVRYDMVTVNATPIVVVPEPQSWALMLAGAAVLGFVARRRA